MTTLPPPRPECLDSEHRWSEYRNHWHRYARDWRAENARRGEPAVADQQIPGRQEYRAGWMAHWRAIGQIWRTEPEISFERQDELHRLLETRNPDLDPGRYPFRFDETQVTLHCADIE